MEHLSIVLMEWLYETEFKDKEKAIEKFLDPKTPFPIDDELIKHFMKNLLQKENLKLLQVLSHPFFSPQIIEQSKIWREDEVTIEIEKQKKKIGPNFETHTSVVKESILTILPELIKNGRNICLISILSYLYLRAIVFYTCRIMNICEEEILGQDQEKLFQHYQFERSKFIKKYEIQKNDNLKEIKKFIGFHDNSSNIGEFNEFLRDPVDFSLVQYFRNSKTNIIAQLRQALNCKVGNDEKNFSIINAEIWT